MEKNNLKPIEIGGIDDPVNISIMEIEEFIYKNKALPITSSLVLEPSTNNYNENGLYSETIFGPVGAPERMVRFGYIDLNTPIFNPEIFSLIVKLGSLYKDIMSGACYATFDPVLKDFVRVVGDHTEVEDCDTGFSFFLKHFNELVFKRNGSSSRDMSIDVIERYRDRSVMVKYLVEPAGLRDIVNDSSGRLVQDEINKLYTSMLMYTKAIPKGSQSSLYDSVRYQIQCKAQEIFEYILNFLDGKRGFIQGSFARRKVANGTRNVITAATLMASNPEDPRLLKADDVVVGVYQTAKGLPSFFKYVWNKLFVESIFKLEYTTNVALTDVKTKKLVYTSISASERDKWTASENIDKMLNSFRNLDLRKKPILVKDEEGLDYALLLVYDEGDTIALCRSIDDLVKRWPRPVDPKKLRPITYIEVFYIITDIISLGKHVLVTRYPVIEQGSCYVGKPHVVSTTPSRAVEVVDLLSIESPPTLMRHYPVLGSPYMDAMMVHPSKLGGLGGDHDGDKVSCEYIHTEDANEECRKYLESPLSVINTDLRFISGGSNYLIDAFLHNLTKRK